MAKVSNEVQLIVALWKEKLRKKRDALKIVAGPYVSEKEPANEPEVALAKAELDGINFAENRLAEIIANLEEGKP